MRLWTLLTVPVLLAAPAALAQDNDNANGGNAGSVTMSSLIAQNYEIKAAVPNGDRFIVFLQKDQSAYACEFATLANSRCGAIQ